MNHQAHHTVMETELRAVLEALRTVKRERDEVRRANELLQRERDEVRQANELLQRERDDANMRLDQECNDEREEREEHERVQLRLRIALQEVTGERDTVKAQLKTVEQERDRATDQHKSVIAEWARLERAAYGAP